jgi:transketolase
VEAASPLGWDKWVGPDGETHCMTTFGESGPLEAVYEHFGFTPERIAERGRALVDKVGARSA